MTASVRVTIHGVPLFPYMGMGFPSGRRSSAISIDWHVPHDGEVILPYPKWRNACQDGLVFRSLATLTRERDIVSAYPKKFVSPRSSVKNDGFEVSMRRM